MKRVRVATVLLVLALVGARAHVGVVTTGVGDNAALGAAWVATWLAAVVVSPIAAVASALAWAATRLTAPIRSARGASRSSSSRCPKDP